MLSHANLLANIRAIGQAMEASSADIFVSWLPLYHDMGLIGAWLGCLYFAAPLYVMSPLSFLTRPESWLWAIHRLRATLSAAPNFAFELCLNKIDDAKPARAGPFFAAHGGERRRAGQRPDPASVHRTVRSLMASGPERWRRSTVLRRTRWASRFRPWAGRRSSTAWIGRR